MPSGRDASGCFIEVLGCLRNTEDYEASMRSFLEAPASIMSADRNGEILYANYETVDLLGCEERDYVA